MDEGVRRSLHLLHITYRKNNLEKLLEKAYGIRVRDGFW